MDKDNLKNESQETNNKNLTNNDNDVKKYNADSIQVLEGLEAVRKRPGMYIGDTGSYGLHHLVWEILDNSIDEVMNGYGNEIIITLTKHHSIIIEDNGRGIPVDIHKKYLKPAIEIIFTSLHSGGKFDEKSYKTSGGLHGVGASVVNALSKKLTAIVWRDKVEYEIIFKDGKVSQELTKKNKVNKKGTKIEFFPDFEIFSCKEFNGQLISSQVMQKAFLNNDLKIVFNDEIREKSFTYQYKEGLKDYLEFLTSGCKKIGNPIIFREKDNKFDIKIAMQYTTEEDESVLSFANNVSTKQGGTHEVGFKTGLTKAVLDFVQETNKTKLEITGQDVRTGIFAIVDIRVPEEFIQYEGQTKNKLSTPEARTFVETSVNKFLKYYFIENRENTNLILDNAMQAAQLRLEIKKQRNIAKLKISKSKDYNYFLGKLVSCQSKDNTLTELFLVEGDSAGGSAKQGRDNKIQAILPLKGKVINAERANLLELLKNDEILTIINAIGCGIGEDFDISKIAYNKIIIMTDADVDGAHIQTLLLTFFFKFMRDLIIHNKLFIAKPPLFKIKNIKNEKEIYYVHSEKDLKATKAKLNIDDNEKSNFVIQRYKGLGEMNAKQLWETTMDPSIRQLIQVKIEETVNAKEAILTLMGSNVESKKEWIEKNIDFSFEESTFL